MLKKLGEVEQEFAKNLAQIPIPAAPASHMPETISQLIAINDSEDGSKSLSTEQKLLKLIEKYKNQLAFGAREYNKVVFR
jgi:hypothetical protein